MCNNSGLSYITQAGPRATWFRISLVYRYRRWNPWELWPGMTRCARSGAPRVNPAIRGCNRENPRHQTGCSGFPWLPYVAPSHQYRPGRMIARGKSLPPVPLASLPSISSHGWEDDRSWEFPSPSLHPEYLQKSSPHYQLHRHRYTLCRSGPGIGYITPEKVRIKIRKKYHSLQDIAYDQSR